ncbi:hypothetical protein [Aeromonas veronii]|uniref:hypothetical protein n=1 Tax=Aeromonas veronii TaxID=654 RepID=UPI001F43592F|nr:hypothetical protein [Aeromonas veronii]
MLSGFGSAAGVWHCQCFRAGSTDPNRQTAAAGKRTATEVWRSSLNTNDLLKAPKPLSFGIEVSTDNFGNQKITSYPQLNLTPEKSVSLSVERFRPKVKFKAGGMNTALRLRGDGIKMQFNPVDKTIPLQIEIKVTDDESSLRLDYRF